MPIDEKGKVILVGAGPGDLYLITVKGLSAVQQADVIIYDHLANDSFLKEAGPETEKIYVGKRSGHHTLKQEEINELVISKAKEGKNVVRLKGGDPFVFGRGGEEALALEKAGIPFEIVPGVTSGIAAPAYAGIPVTHRNTATSVTFITGHEDPNKDNSQLSWEAIAAMHGTLVFYMGVRNLADIVKKLLKHGKSPDTPVAVIRQGTTPQQITITGPLSSIEQRVQAADLKPPALIIVGPVVDLRKELNWYEKRPLFGRKVIVTRSRSQASDLVKKLEQLGAEVLSFPTIKILPPSDYDDLDWALVNLDSYSWIVFTSVNGVNIFFNRLRANNLDARALSDTKICAIGPATAGRLQGYGLLADLLPETYVAEALVEAFKLQNIAGQRMLLPRADLARPELRDGLLQLGAVIHEIKVYRTVMEDQHPNHVLEQIRRGDFDLITFTSTSTVNNFISRIGQEHIQKVFSRAKVASIGPITRQAGESVGIMTDIQPQEYTIPALVEAIVEYYNGN